MLRSMTGYGRGEAEAAGWHYVLQIKSVNNRFLEAPLKLPAALWKHEAEARAMLQKALSRGKLDLHYRERWPEDAEAGVEPNLPLASSYLRALEKLAQGLGLKSEVRLEQVARYPEVLSASSGDEDAGQSEARWEAFRMALELALQDLQKSREREGAALEAELRKLLSGARELAGKIERKSAELQPLFLERLKKRMQDVLGGAATLDEPRLVGEAAILADKADIREELVRFATHAAEFERLLSQGGVAGKRLDFLGQELLREANTMGSKSPDAGLTQMVVALKSEIEKVKEQIQNLE